MPNETTSEVKSYLESYAVNRRMLQMMKYENEYFHDRTDYEDDDCLLIPGGDEIFLKAKMFEVRRFVMTLANNNCKLFLFYHYIRGESVAHCAELLGISRTSAFRLKHKALLYAATKYGGLFGDVPRSA